MSTIFETQEPQDLSLRKYISHYYFHSSSDPKNRISFSYYPNYKNALTLYKDAKVTFLAPTFSKITPKKGVYISAYAQIYKRFAKTEIHGAFQKIGVVFNPLGMSHFIDVPISELMTSEVNADFNYFDKELDLIRPELFSSNNEQKTILLDRFFKSQLRPFTEPRMLKAVDLLFEDATKHSVQGLANELEISRKTLLRLFKRHLNCSVQDYMTLIQFRKAVDVYQKAAEKPSFTGLALDLNYYDQSDFIHHFKEITNVNPKKFFDNLKEFGNHDTFWSVE